MVGGDRVAQVKERVSFFDGSRRRQLLGHAFEKWRALDVRGGRIPRIELSVRGVEIIPAFVATGDFGVHLLEHAGNYVRSLHLLDLIS